MQTLIERPVRPAAATAPADAPAGPPCRVLRGSAWILALRGLALGPTLLVAIALARLLGQAGFGAYQTALAWLAVLAVPAGLGVEKLVVQRLSAHRARNEWSRTRGLLRAAFAAVVGCSALTAIGAGAVAMLDPALAGFGGLWLAAAILPAMSVLRVVQATLQGFDRVVAAQVPELLVVPLLLLLGLGFAWLGFDALTPTAALAILLAANLTALGIGLAFVWRQLPWDRIRAVAPSYDLGAWCRTAGPLLAIAALMVVNARADVVMLGALAGVETVGPYSAALRCAGLIAVVLVSANNAIAPAIARHHSLGEHAELQRVLTRTVRFVAAIGATGAALFVVFGEFVLSVFGPGFVEARTALTVLSLTQLAVVAMSAPGLVLMMTGHVRLAAIGLLAGAAVNLAANWLLIPAYGGTGAAVATMLGTLSWTVGLAWVVRRRLGLDTTVFGRLP